MTRFLQQNIPMMTERSMPEALCPSCPKRDIVVGNKRKQEKKSKKSKR